MFSRICAGLVIGTFGLMIYGCGSSTPSNDSMDNNFTILEGTVPGTLIEAFCTDGTYYAVHSTDNNTSQHPFALTIPKNLNCHLVMSTNENNLSTKVVSPITIETNNGSSSLFYGQSDTANLDYVPLSLDRNEIEDRTGDGVLDNPLLVAVASGTLVTVLNTNDPMDRDGDGIINIYEDDDEDGKYNHEDDDDDGDGIKDEDDDEYANDRDGDGIEDDEDDDDDNDGIDDEDDHDDDEED